MSVQVLDYSGTQLIFRQEDGLLHVPDTEALLVWQALRSGISVVDICTQIAAQHEQAECLAKLNQLQTQWQAQGLLDQLSAPPHPTACYCQWIQPAQEPVAVYTNYLAIHEYIAYVYRACLLAESHNSVAASLTIVFQEPQNTYQLFVNQTLKHEHLSKDQALIVLCYEIGELATHEEPRLLVFHAAAVAYRENTLLMPAQAGRGKTTLTATLLAHNAQLINDDIVPLNHDGTVTAINQPLKIKAGAWDVVGLLYPELERLPAVQRPDGIWMKHLSLPAALVCQAGSRYSVQVMVVPEFNQDAAVPTLVALNPVQTLQHLLAAEPYFTHTLTRPYLQRLLQWLAPLPGYKITYSNSQDAMLLLDTICQELPAHA
ncbi:MAG: hypothetical protein L3K52_14255 [Candidatus Thiothrix sulfatifontis]|nr:MAG: hypothetical protein L3K52_14255 [Candidatus Thiothrix sulfatifontis]